MPIRDVLYRSHEAVGMGKSDCGVIHDRDHNAAINLKNMAVSSTVTACGAIRSGPDLAVRTKRIAVKQEPTHGIFVHV